MQTEVEWTVNALIFYHDMALPFELRVRPVRGNSFSVRDYGLRTYKSRQGRNAATVV